MSAATEGRLLWEPSAAMQEHSRMRAYMRWLAATRDLHFHTYAELWQWSVTELEAFWGSLWEYFAITASQPYTAVLERRTMPGAVWFPGARLNYTEHVFRHAHPTHPAVLFQNEEQPLTPITWATLHRQVATIAAALRALGVQQGGSRRWLLAQHSRSIGGLSGNRQHRGDLVVRLARFWQP